MTSSGGVVGRKKRTEDFFVEDDLDVLGILECDGGDGGDVSLDDLVVHLELGESLDLGGEDPHHIDAPCSGREGKEQITSVEQRDPSRSAR